MTFNKAVIITSLLTLALASPAATKPDDFATHEAPPVRIIGPGTGEVGLIFLQDYQPTLVIRDLNEMQARSKRDAITTETALAETIVKDLAAGPLPSEIAAGVEHFLPEGTIATTDFEDSRSINIYLEFPREFMEMEFDSAFIEEMGRHFIESLNGLGFGQIVFYGKNHESDKFVDIWDLLPPEPEIILPPSREPTSPEPTEQDLQPVVPRGLPAQNGFVNGALTGRRVVLNASHGWYDNTHSTNRWTVQRANTWQVLEDFASPMFMNQYVLPMLQNAGAIVRTVREPDTQTHTVVIDNAMGSPRYVESGSGWIFSGLNGYTHKEQYNGRNDHPYTSGQTSRLIRGVTSGAPTHSATFTPTIPANGYYNVYISYTAGSDRTTNAHWQVRHSGGVTDFRVNQRITGSTFFLLGNFYFEKDAPASEASVIALNDNGDTDYLSVDAVKFGGGMGNVARRTHGVSNRPRWQEEATNFLQYNGMMQSNLFHNSSSTSPANDRDEALGWTNRPRAARWEHQRDNLGLNITYIAWHTNASTWKCVGGVEHEGPGRGTLVIRDLVSNATPQTIDFTKKVRDGMFYSVRASYDSSWPMRSPGTDGMLISNQYGEALQGRLGAVPGFIFEGVFHDNIADSNAYKDGKFRYAAARGIVNGLIQYYGSNVFPPEPVRNIRVKNIGNNQVRIEWARGPVGNASNRIGSAATNFRLYKSSNGHGFDNGTDVGNTLSHTMTLTPGELVFLRIAAVNSAGISIASQTIASRVPTAGNRTILLVNGFQRDDRHLAPLRSQTNIGGCTQPNIYREMDPRKYQARNYVIQHAKAIANKGGYGLDYCLDDSINANHYNMTDYQIAVWMGGQQAEVDGADGVDDTSFKPAARTAIQNYLTAGNNLFVSGSELAWDFGRPATAQDKKTFLSTWLKATFVNDDANTYNANGNSGIFAGLGTINFDNGSGTTYDVAFPDVLQATGGATSCMVYSGGTGGTAAIQYAGTFGSGTKPGKLVYMGFPFEAINAESARNNVMSRVLDYFIPADVEEWDNY